jgi:ribose transport system substrate-binding protein
VAQQGADAHYPFFETTGHKLLHPESRHGLLLRSTVSLTDSRSERMVQMYYISTRTILPKLRQSLSQGTTLPTFAQCLRNSIAVISFRPRFVSWRSHAFLASLAFMLVFPACGRRSNTIAVIPRACGTALWEPEHAGATHVARRRGFNVYWNASPREDDVEGQIDFLEKVVAKGYAGIIITPDETLPLRTPIRRIVSGGLPMVVVGTNLGIAPSSKLSYVLNDDTAGGQLAARRVGKILNGRGSIAILGINPQLSGITTRERSFENTLEQEYPNIQVVARRFGYYSVPQEQQVAEDILNQGVAVDAIVALSHISTRGAFYALVEFDKIRTIKLLGFDQDLMVPIRSGGIDSVVMERTYDMGRIAMEVMDGQIHNQTVPGMSVVPPVLMTRENMDTPEIRQQLTANWWAGQ